MRRPFKMLSDPRNRENTKYCTFHGDYDHLIEDCKHLIREVNKLSKEGNMKKFVTSNG